jgi:hypothetical protein
MFVNIKPRTVLFASKQRQPAKGLAAAVQPQHRCGAKVGLGAGVDQHAVVDGGQGAAQVDAVLATHQGGRDVEVDAVGTAAAVAAVVGRGDRFAQADLAVGAGCAEQRIQAAGVAVGGVVGGRDDDGALGVVVGVDNGHISRIQAVVGRVGAAGHYSIVLATPSTML